MLSSFVKIVLGNIVVQYKVIIDLYCTTIKRNLHILDEII